MARRIVTKPVLMLDLSSQRVTCYLPSTPKRMNSVLARGVKPCCGSTLTAVARLEGKADPEARDNVRSPEDTDCRVVTACGAIIV